MATVERFDIEGLTATNGRHHREQTTNKHQIDSNMNHPQHRIEGNMELTATQIFGNTELKATGIGNNNTGNNTATTWIQGNSKRMARVQSSPSKRCSSSLVPSSVNSLDLATPYHNVSRAIQNLLSGPSLKQEKRSGGQFWRESQLSHCGIAEVNVNSKDTDIENERVELVILKVGKESQMNILDNDPQYDNEYDNAPLIRLLNKL
eukprot:jgi/Psemu1/18007/gm1.18007_g